MSSIFENRCNYSPNSSYSKSKLHSPTQQTMKTGFCKQETDEPTKTPSKDDNNAKCLKEDWNIFAAAQALTAARAQLFNQVTSYFQMITLMVRQVCSAEHGQIFSLG